MLWARARIEAEGAAEGTGFAADLLVPKWFDKDPALTPDADAAALIDSAHAASASFRIRGRWPSALFELWLAVFGDCVLSSASKRPELVRGFGVSLVERALIDALCRAAGKTFFGALEEDLFGFRPELVHPVLEGWDLAASLPERPRETLRIRHTIGLADPLAGDELLSRDRIDDGLPETLEDHVRVHGVDAFKIKLAGDPRQDVERLRAISAVLGKLGVEKPLITFDANEQYSDLAALLGLLRSLESDPAGPFLLENLAYVEQPLPRARAFHPSVESGLSKIARFAPVIIDESDSGTCGFERAIACGYRGVSVKGCKGIFRALLHRGLCDRIGRGLFLTSEDLTTLPILSLHEDLALLAALDLPHAERNGHHYFTRLEHLTEGERAGALAAHSDLYEDHGAGPQLSIRGGRIRLGSVQCVGFGYHAPVDFDARSTLEDWSFR